MTESETLPMFPLGTVLFPSMLLPLRIFEPRYRAMIRECLAGDRRFGVVLIERGSEVGGGDQRSNLGCVASVVQASERSDGQWLLTAMGTQRIRVREWLEDDPFPRALVERHHDTTAVHPDAVSFVELVSTFRRVLALAAELDEWSVPFGLELAEDPNLAVYQMCAASPLGVFDRQRLLGCDSLACRVEWLARLLAETEELLGQRLAHG